MKIRAVIVEDSRLARNELLELLKPYHSIEVVGQADSVASALCLIDAQRPDLLFLDINLPDGDGFALLDALPRCPQVIFTTAYDEFAIQAFERSALDYLLKPISEQRFQQALEKVTGDATGDQENPNGATDVQPINHKIFVKDNDRCWLIDVQEVRCFISHGNHTQIHFQQHQPMVYKSLSQIQQRLPAKQFFRVNRSHIININFVKDIETYGQSGLLLTLDDGREIDVSRRHASHLKQALSF